MTRWNKILALVVACGFGVGLGVATGFSALAWYKRLPKRWDSTTLRGRFEYLDLQRNSEKQYVGFVYSIENAGTLDYRATCADLGVVAVFGNGVSLPHRGDIVGECPVWIAPGQRLRYVIHMTGAVPGDQFFFPDGQPPHLLVSPEQFLKKKFGWEIMTTVPSQITMPDRDFRVRLSDWVKRQLPDLQGFMYFDHTGRYQVKLMKGW